MEEKERYELFGEHCIKDNNPDARCQLLDTYKACVLLNEQDKENKQLKQQLAEKDKEIERLKMYDEYRFELPYPKVKILGKTFEDIQELIDKWLKQGSKDKISCAVEQLEKVKNYMITDEKDMFGANYLMNSEYVLEFIDNQIKQLKEIK